MICPRCGAFVSDNEYMCQNCFTSLPSVKASDSGCKRKTNNVSVLKIIIPFVLIIGFGSLAFYFISGGSSFFSANKSSLIVTPSSDISDESIVSTVTVTFREGLRLLQVAELLEENGVCDADSFVKTTQTMDISSYSFSNDIEKNADERYYRLEGYLFPDTYEFYLNDEPERVAERMLRNYDKRITAALHNRADDLNMSMDQVITLASIITKEAYKAEDMPLVSSVFHNRLNDSYGKLESDPTYYYPYASREGVPDEQKDSFESRYNTYKIKGLPPGAICNPGLDAIEAALNPADTDYYFFVYDMYGKYYFAKTWEEHKKNVSIINNIKSEENASKESVKK